MTTNQVRGGLGAARRFAAHPRLARTASLPMRRGAASQVDTSVQKDAVHYAIDTHEYGGAALLRDWYSNKGACRRAA